MKHRIVGNQQPRNLVLISQDAINH